MSSGCSSSSDVSKSSMSPSSLSLTVEHHKIQEFINKTVILLGEESKYQKAALSQIKVEAIEIPEELKVRVKRILATLNPNDLTKLNGLRGMLSFASGSSVIPANAESRVRLSLA